MIRVNLLRSLGMAQASPGIVSGSEFVSVDLKKQAAIKGLVILIFPFMLIGWEQVNLSALESEIMEIQQQISRIETEKAKYGDASPKVEKFTKEREKIEKELDIIRSLTTNRLREVKALDQLQSLVPPTTWLTKVSIVDNKINMEGYTIAERGVPDLMSSIENSAFFSNVIPGDTSRAQLSTGSALQFKLSFQIGTEGAESGPVGIPMPLPPGGVQ